MRYVILFLLFVLSAEANAQSDKNEKGKITGKVLDSLSQTPIYYAIIEVFPGGDTKSVNGAIADEKGNFTIGGLAFGNYRLEISFIGYTTAVIKNVILSSQKPVTKPGIILLPKKTNTLSEVNITAQKSMVEYKSDKIVYNAENDMTSQGGVATDVLKKVPQVSVDVDGNVEVQGNASILFLINGKPSGMFGNNPADALKAIPASQIKNIEVITNPGAKYDGKGTGGIINIVLKDNKLQGVNGSVNLSAGTRLENAAINLNIQKGNFGINAFFSGNAQVNSTTLLSSYQTSHDNVSGNTFQLWQNGSSNYKRYGSIAGLGLDWGITKRDNLTINAGANLGGNYNNGPTAQQITNTDSMGSIISNSNTVRNTVTEYYFRSFDWSLNYVRTFKKEKQELSILYSSSYAFNYNYYLLSQSYASGGNPFQGSTNNNPGTDWETNIQLDYAQPIGKNILIETGGKYTLEKLSAKINASALSPLEGDYDPDTSQSYHVKFDRNIYSSYLSGSFNFFEHLQFKAGLRYERTENKGYFSNVSHVTIAPYNSWLPSANISYEFKNNQSLRLAYSHRIERPEYRELNPFVNSSDPHNISTGNPALQPELSDKIELAYRKSFEKYVSFNLSLFYQKNSQDIKSPVTYYPQYRVGDSVYTNVSVTNRANIGAEHRGGLSAYLSIETPFKLRFTSNIMVYERYIQSNLIAGNATGGIEYRINGNLSYQFVKGLQFEIFANYNSPRTGLQGKYPSFVSYSFALRKQFLNEKISIAFSCTNIFDEYVKQTTILSSAAFDLSTMKKIPYRSFGLNFVYKFGKLRVKKKKEEDNGNGNNPFE